MPMMRPAIFSNATFSLNTGNSSLTDNLNGTGAINLKRAMANGTMNTGFEIKHGEATSHALSLTYTDVKGCDNTILRNFVVNPHPTLGIEYNEVVGANIAGDPIEGTGICYSEDVFDIRGIQEGITAIPSAGTIVWDINSGGLTSDGATGLSSLDPPTAAFALGALDSLADNTQHDITFEFTDLNGCLSDTVRTIEVVKLPTLNIVYNADVFVYNEGDEIDGTEICFDEGTISVKGLERSDDAVSQRDAVNTNGTITWAINTDGITSVDSGNSATVILRQQHCSVVMVQKTIQQIMTLLSLIRMLDLVVRTTLRKTVTFNPLPTLEIFSGGDPLEAQEFCYEDQSISLSSTHETGALDAAGIISNASFSVSTGNSSLTDNSNGTAVINLKEAMKNESDSTGFYIKHGYATTHTVSLTYEDSEGCINTITRDFVCEPSPNIRNRV